MLNKFEKYLTAEKRNASHTVIAYINDIGTFLTFATVENEKDLNEVSYQIVRAWMVDLIDSGVNNRSVNRKLSALRTFFRWAKRSQIITIDPMLRIKGPKQEKRLPEFVKQSEIQPDKIDDLFSNDHIGFRDRVMVELFYQTGIRLSELINIKESDIQNESVKVLGKRNKERIIPLSLDLTGLINRFLGEKVNFPYRSPYLLCTDKGNKLYPKFVYRKINYYLSLITKLRKKSPHVLRHTFATHMLNNGAGLESLKEVLGHANLSATQVYTHNSFDEITKIYKQAHPRGHKKK